MNGKVSDTKVCSYILYLSLYSINFVNSFIVIKNKFKFKLKNKDIGTK